VVGGKVYKRKNKLDWGHKEEKNSKTKIEIRVEKRKENKLNLPTTLVSTMREKNCISVPRCTHGC
jgi:hypothetical protein